MIKPGVYKLDGSESKSVRVQWTYSFIFQSCNECNELQDYEIICLVEISYGCWWWYKVIYL